MPRLSAVEERHADRVRRRAPRARIVFVGEQPGDHEDLAASRSSARPAGCSIGRCTEAAIDRKATYVTNAVKHFKFEPRGKRRIHKKPSELEIRACHQWLERELTLIRPALDRRARRDRGPCRVRPCDCDREESRPHHCRRASARSHEADVLVTVHPSYLLRVPDEDRDTAYEHFVDDLKLIRPTLHSCISFDAQS